MPSGSSSSPGPKRDRSRPARQSWSRICAAVRDIVKPNLAPKTYETREMIGRLYIIPFLGTKRIDKLTARDIRQWLNQLRDACQCCIQGKDARRARGKQRCCAIGRCCHQAISGRTLRDARDVLRAALGYAVSEDELITRNVASLVRLPAPRTRKAKAWTVAERPANSSNPPALPATRCTPHTC